MKEEQMKRKTIFTAALCCLLLANCQLARAMSVDGNTRSIDGPVAFTQPEHGEWYMREGKWHFNTANGEIRNRWLCIENKNGERDWFCFDAQGVMCTGWQKSGSGNWYYLRETADGRQGAMERGFILDPSDGSCYYLDPATGVMRTGWVSAEGNAYYFAEHGEGAAWYWNAAESKWKNTGEGRPCGSMYINERTPDGSAVDALGRKIL